MEERIYRHYQKTELLKPGGVLDSVPVDPVNDATYFYDYGVCGTSGYVVKATLEEANKKMLDESYTGADCDISCAVADNEYCIKF